MPFLKKLPALSAKFHRELERQARDRGLREEILPGETEPGWVTHERELMLRLVNDTRREHGMAPASREKLMVVENSAVGHSDYTLKFSIRAAELALTP